MPLLFTDIPKSSSALASEKHWHLAIMHYLQQEGSKDRFSYKFSNSWNGVWSKKCLRNHWCFAGREHRSRHCKSNSLPTSHISYKKPVHGLPPSLHELPWLQSLLFNVFISGFLCTSVHVTSPQSSVINQPIITISFITEPAAGNECV